MTLHVECMGSGPNLVLLHGWGFHSGVWQPLAERLATGFRVILVDLPGHGQSASVPQGGQLEAVAKAVADVVPSPAFWLGWSLGGLVALQVAIKRPEEVKKLVLVASTPRFVTAADWPAAIAPEVLADFAKALKKDLTGVLKRFVLLQIRGSEQAKAVAPLLFAQLTSSIRPGNKEGLSAGLALLKASDLRANLFAVCCPTLVMMGERDPLVPVSVGHWMVSHLPQGQMCTIPGAGHAPFLSHLELFENALENFLKV